MNELILDTRSFLRGQADWLPDDESVEPAEEGVGRPLIPCPMRRHEC